MSLPEVTSIPVPRPSGAESPSVSVWADTTTLYVDTAMTFLHISLCLSPGMAILGCQLDYIWNELQSRNGGHPCDLDLEAGRQHAFDSDLEAGRHTFNLGHSFCQKPM